MFLQINPKGTFPILGFQKEKINWSSITFFIFLANSCWVQNVANHVNPFSSVVDMKYHTPPGWEAFLIFDIGIVLGNWTSRQGSEIAEGRVQEDQCHFAHNSSLLFALWKFSPSTAYPGILSFVPSERNESESLIVQ